MSILYKKRIQIGQAGLKTKLGGAIGLVATDYTTGQSRRVNSVGSVYTPEKDTISGIDRTAVTVSPADGQIIPTKTQHHPIAAPINILTGKPASLANIKMRQMNLQKAGLYKGSIDGIWGKDSDAAWQQHIRSTPELRKFWKVKDM